MAYKFELPKAQMSALWSLREYAGRGPISRQIREVVAQYISAQEKEIGCPVTDLAEAVDRYEQENNRA